MLNINTQRHASTQQILSFSFSRNNHVRKYVDQISTKVNGSYYQEAFPQSKEH